MLNRQDFYFYIYRRLHFAAPETQTLKPTAAPQGCRAYMMHRHTPKAYYTLCLFLFLLPGQLLAQEFRQNFKAMNAFYLEVGGNSDVYSVNYDRVVYQQEMFKAAFRAGLGTNLFFLKEEPAVYPVVPVEAMALVGRRRKHFEGGLGYTHRFTDDPDLLQSMYFARLGFRYQVPRGGLLVRVAITPFISPDKNSRTPGVGVIPRFGFSVGQSF